MSFILFGNLPVSVPPVLDTTPCMESMLDYEDCISDTDDFNKYTIHPSFPSIFPTLFTTGDYTAFKLQIKL